MIKYNINYTLPFIEDLHRIYYYLSLYSSKTANNFFEKVMYFTSRLDLFPERYSKITNIQRKMPLGNYIIIYEVDNTTNQVFILHIFYGRQNYSNNL